MKKAVNIPTEQIYNIVPVPKPRMTQSDDKDNLEKALGHVSITE